MSDSTPSSPLNSQLPLGQALPQIPCPTMSHNVPHSKIDFPSPPPQSRGVDCLFILLAALITLGLRGYQFGQSNHGIYLLDALRRVDPSLLANDWWVTRTLQYNGVFSWATAGLWRMHILQPAFLAGYLGLVVLLHLGWWRLARLLGAGAREYLASVALFYLAGAGFGLGMYEFLQDRSFLPSNIASVAMLWAIVMWIERKWLWAGVWIGLAGLAHLNFAVVGVGVWGALSIIDARRLGWRWVGGTVVMAGLCLADIWPAMRVVRGEHGGIPLDQFVDLYVRLRHPHHYDVRSWPVVLWIAFLLPLPCLVWFARDGNDAAKRITFVCAAFLGMLGVALLGAGIWYVNEHLIQLSLWRFSIYPKMISCTAAGTLLYRHWPRVAKGLIGIVLAGAAVWGAVGHEPFTRVDDPDYVHLCQWARGHTDKDAVFLVPPQELSMRLVGERAIVVNYKGVPQLAAEMGEWKQRLEDVLGIPILTLPRRMDRTLDAIGRRYDDRSAAQLTTAARKYHARYIVTHGEKPGLGQAIHREGNYWLYQP
jgi:hypothetical protein